MASGDIIFESGFYASAIEWDGRFVTTSSNLFGLDQASSNQNYGHADLKLNGGDAYPSGAGWPDKLSKIQPARTYKITITEV